MECDICGSVENVMMDQLLTEHGSDTRYLCEKCEDVRDQEQPIEPPPCPVCDGDGRAMGGLGFLTWFHCQYCGIEWSVDERKENVA